jgi:plastocyanin
MKAPLLVTLILTLLVLSACTPYQALVEDDRTRGPVIKIKDYRFLPQEYRISAGTIVTWRNDDRDAHSLQVNDVTSWQLDTGEFFSYNFTEPGTYHYSSGNHPFIEGTIKVN